MAEGAGVADKAITGRQSYFLEVPGAAHASGTSVVSFNATERLGEPYRVTLVLTHAEELSRAEFLRRDAVFAIDPGDGSEPRRFSGCIVRFSRIRRTRDFHLYEFEIAPRVALLALTRASRVFQRQTGPQIIEAILRRHGLTGHQFVFKLRRTYPEHAFRLQYQMSDWDFIRLLMEQEGIYSYFLPNRFDPLFGDQLVFGDDIDHYIYQPTLAAPYREASGLSADTEAVFSLRTHATTIEQSFRTADYNPADSWERKDGEANVARGDKTTYGQSYVYGTHHLDFEQARWEARLRHEAAVARQVVYEGESNILALRPARILGLDIELPDAPDGQVVTEVVHAGARDAAYSNRYRAIPSDRPYRLPIDDRQWPRIAGTLSGRVTSPNQYKYAYLTRQGLYTVRLDLDFDDWPKGTECVPLRFAKPFAGARETGFHFPLIDGTEVAIAFRDGNPNKPYIAHAHHHQRHEDPVTGRDRWLSRNVIRTQSNNKLRMEDWEGQEGIKLSTEHGGKTQLNLGHLVTRDRKRRGEGFELRTDLRGSLRAGGGVLVSADRQQRAGGQQLDMAPALGQWQVSMALATGLNDAARLARAEVADLRAENAWLRESVNELKQAVIALSAPAGIAAATPERISLAAGNDIGVKTGRTFHVNAMRNVALAASEAISLFAHKLGLRLFAARGKVLIQAQSDAMELVAAQNMQLTSANGTLTANAKNGVVISGGGSAYIKVHGDNVEIGGAGRLILKLIEIQKSDPGSLSLPLPAFGQVSTANNEHFVLNDAVTGAPAANRAYRIELADGKIVEGITDANGHTSLLTGEVAQGMKLLRVKLDF
ncbi:type VI secretion system secreted protein VgrG [Cupriavidus agavae]|uniref:Type VI secretion system secreted protein VgrG n=2 Tax=Cupriavidus agavae TaxID=1001822 RepID=A0A4Q7RDR9_9BURK|nr:type VI secretion system secreted protein VgrG [Cupriavidus agavae]